MIDFSRPIGNSSGVGPLLYNPPVSSPNMLGPFSFGASNFATGYPAMPLIPQGYGTGRTYSPFGFSGMYGSIGVGAPMVGSGYYIGPGPNFLDMSSLFMSIWQATFGPRQTMPAGPASQYAPPQPPPPAAGEAGDAKTGSAGQTGGADKAEGSGAAGGDWKDKVAKGFDVPGVRLVGTAEKDGKKVAKLEPSTGFDARKAGPKLARALQTLHRNGVDTVLIGDKEDKVATGHRVTSKTKKDKKGKFIKTWAPNTGGVLKALQKAAPKAPAAKPAADAAAATPDDVSAALTPPLSAVKAAKYEKPADKKSHRIVVMVAKGANPNVVAMEMVTALDAAGKAMKKGGKKASGQQITVEFAGDRADAESVLKEYKRQSKDRPSLPTIIAVASVKRA